MIITGKIFIVSINEKPCIICNKPTKRIEVQSENRICSDECQKISDNIYEEAINKMSEMI